MEGHHSLWTAMRTDTRKCVEGHSETPSIGVDSYPLFNCPLHRTQHRPSYRSSAIFEGVPSAPRFAPEPSGHRKSELLQALCPASRDVEVDGEVEAGIS